MSQAHYSWHTLSPPVSSSPWSPLLLNPSSPPPPSAAPRGIGDLRAWHAPCLACCYTPISRPSQAECTNPKTLTDHIWPKGAFCPLFHLSLALASHAITVDVLCLAALAFFFGRFSLSKVANQRVLGMHVLVHTGRVFGSLFWLKGGCKPWPGSLWEHLKHLVQLKYIDSISFVNSMYYQKLISLYE